MNITDAGVRPAKTKSLKALTTINSLDHDILCMIFPFLDLFDLVRCSVVCKSWSEVINKSKLLQVFYYRHQLGSASSSKTTTCSEKSLKQYLEDVAIERHRLALQEGLISIDQWRGHSERAYQCRLKMGLLLTGVGDKFMRLWSVESYQCLENYSIPDTAPLVDFDFDESKIVGLIGTRLCIWRRNGNRSIFPSREGTFPIGLCMRYFDPEAIVGCEDGTARVFDMYSKKCSRIIRMHDGPITCLCLSDDQLVLSGSSLGSIKISGLLSDQRVAALRLANTSTGIKALCFNPSSHLVFAGSTAGYVHCWDLRLVVGGIDGVLRILNQNTGELCSSSVMEGKVLSRYQNRFGVVERKKGRRLSENDNIDIIHRSGRPPITCLAVGMKKVVTMHNDKHIRAWKFNDFK